MRPIRTIVALGLATLLAGCATQNNATQAPAGPSGPPADDPDSPTTPRSPLPTRPGATTGTTTGTTTSPPKAEALTDFEEALAGTWRRYHVANRGYSNEYEYYEYLSFNEDRTACRWKYGQDSSSSYTDDVFSSSDYTNWKITEELYGGNYFRVVVAGSGLDYVFDFVKNRVYPVDYDNLIFTPNTDGKSCFVRDGSSY